MSRSPQNVWNLVITQPAKTRGNLDLVCRSQDSTWNSADTATVIDREIRRDLKRGPIEILGQRHGNAMRLAPFQKLDAIWLRIVALRPRELAHSLPVHDGVYSSVAEADACGATSARTCCTTDDRASWRPRQPGRKTGGACATKHAADRTTQTTDRSPDHGPEQVISNVPIVVPIKHPHSSAPCELFDRTQSQHEAQYWSLVPQRSFRLR
jgi:hypothetical protein